MNRDTGFKKGQILYSVEDVSAEMHGTLPIRGYRVVDPRTGWEMDRERNPHISGVYVTFLVRKVTRDHGEWVDGDLACVREGDVDGAISEEDFRERCRRWAEPEKGTPEHWRITAKKIAVLYEELGTETRKSQFGSPVITDDEILRLLELDKKVRNA